MVLVRGSQCDEIQVGKLPFCFDETISDLGNESI